MKFLGHVMREEGLENLILTRQIMGKVDRGKQRETYLMGLSKWMVEQQLEEITKRQNLLRATSDRKM